jgi:hypothetical protein
MYFWRIKSLKEELRRGPLPPRSAFAYVLATFLLFQLMAGVPGLWNVDPADITSWTWVAFGLTAIVLVLGMYAAYQANGGAAGEDFAARYLALGWVLGLRILVFGIGALILVAVASVLVAIMQGAVTPEGDLPDEILPAWLTDLFSVALAVVFYWRLVHHFRSLAAPATPAAALPPAA